MTRNSQLIIKFILLQLSLLMLNSEASADVLKLRPENFTHYTIEDGLPQNNIRCIEEDQYGILWLCTADGLVRYDGYDFESISEGADGSRISNTIVRAILADGDSLWIATENGLNVFDLKLGTFEQIKLHTSSNASEYIQSLLKVNNDYWIGTTNGIYLIKITNNGKKNISKIIDEVNARDMLLVADSVIVANYGTSIIQISTVTKLTKKIKKFTSEFSNRILHLNFNKGKLFLSTYGSGVIILDDELNVVSRLKTCELESNNCISSKYVFFTKHYKGRIWIGSFQGLTVLNERTYEVENMIYMTKYINNNYITDSIKSIYFTQKNIWFGQHPGGFIKYRLAHNGVEVYLSNRNNNAKTDRSVYAIAKNDMQTYVATFNGLFYVDKDNIELNTVSAVNDYLVGVSKRVSTLCFYDAYNLFIGTENGIYLYDTLVEKISVFKLLNAENDQRIRALNCNKDRTIVTTESGYVYRYSNKTNSFILLKNNEDIETIYSIEDDGLLYFSTYRGVMIFKLQDDVLTKVNSILDNKRVVVSKLTNSYLIIGTVGDGLYRWNIDDGYLEKIPLDYNVIGNTIYDMSIIDNFIWISTNNGIVKLNLDTMQYFHYIQAHGLGDKEYSLKGLLHSKKENLLLAGGLTGLTVINLSEFEKNQWRSNQIITKVSVMNNKGVVIRNYFNNPKTININEGNTLLFQLGNKDSYIRYKSNFNYQIKKLLSAVTTKLRPSQREISLVDISSSNFEMSIGDGKAYSLIVNVTPYLWKRWWSYLIYFIILVFIIRAIVLQQNSIRATKNKQILSDKELDLKRKQLASLSHELRTPLNAIIGITEATLDAELDIKHIKSSAHLLRSLIDNALDSISLEMNTSINLSNSSFSINDVILDITEILNLYIVASEIKISIIICDDVPVDIVSDKVRVQQILLNIIKNALKHSETATEIIIRVSYINNILKTSIKDNGIGISFENQSFIFDVFHKIDNNKSGFGLGLYISKLISNALGGNLTLDSELGKGSTFTLLLPIIPKAVDKQDVVSNHVIGMRRISNLLILEDDQLNIYTLNIQLKKLNYESYLIVSDYDAFCGEDVFKYDCIVLDLNFGHENINGIDVAKSLKEKKYLGLIYLLTAESDLMVQEKASKYVNGYIVKPLSLRALEEILYSTD